MPLNPNKPMTPQVLEALIRKRIPNTRLFITVDTGDQTDITLPDGTTIHTPYGEVMVSVDQLVQWIQDLVTPLPSPIPQPIEDVRSATVIADALNVRNGPGVEFDVLGQLPYGTAIGVVPFNTNWAKLRSISGVTQPDGKFVSLLSTLVRMK